MSYTITRSVTDTYTEVRARYVMGKVYDHLIGIYTRGFISKQTADDWRDQLMYMLGKRAVNYFQFQFTTSTGLEYGIHYEVRADASVTVDDDSGGLDFWGLPNNTSVTLLVQLNRNSSSIQEVDRQVAAWGWGTGTALQGTHTASKTFSKDGFGLKESTIGQW